MGKIILKQQSHLHRQIRRSSECALSWLISIKDLQVEFLNCSLQQLWWKIDEELVACVSSCNTCQYISATSTVTILLQRSKYCLPNLQVTYNTSICWKYKRKVFSSASVYNRIVLWPLTTLSAFHWFSVKSRNICSLC